MKDENRDKYFLGNISNTHAAKGYFIGYFMGEKGFPILETDEVEVAWKKLPIKFEEQKHYHRKGVEITIVISGGYTAEINGKKVELKQHDFLVVYPQSTLKMISSFEDTEVIVIKAPSVPNDKFEE